MSLEVEKILKEEFQDATEAEIARFVAGYGSRGSAEKVKQAVEKKLEAYLDWRNRYGLDYVKTEEASSDSADWDISVKKAWEIGESLRKAKELAKKLEKEAKIPDEKVEADYDKKLEEAVAEETGEKALEENFVNDDGDGDKNRINPAELDQVIFFHTNEGESICDKNGFKIMHVLPARINRKLAPAAIYANIFAFFIDRKFDRSSLDKVTILFDVRAGEGWPNSPAISMVKFIQVVAKVLQDNFPERVEKLIIFPVPRIAIGLYKTIKFFFTSRTAEKVVLVSGPAAKDSPLPRSEIEKHMSSNVLEQSEKARLSCIKNQVEDDQKKSEEEKNDDDKKKVVQI